MPRIGQQMKASKQAGGASPWSKAGSGGRSDECPGCGVKYKKMSAGKLRAHFKIQQSGNAKDCPDV